MQSNKISEGGHKAGCTCGFCQNKGKFGKKDDAKDGMDKGGDKKKKPDGPSITAESIVSKLLED